jgi:tetratricopeptide (TPR) repeat protein
MTVKKAAGAARTMQGLETFEKAAKALGKRDFERARELLDVLLSQHASERDLVERARAYRAICDRALDKKTPRPKTFEEFVTYGVLLHNRGEFEDAVKHLQQAVEMHPRNESALYCLAAAAARAGDTAAAVKALRGAISANPANRSQARADEDFEDLRDLPEFDSLVHPEEDDEE